MMSEDESHQDKRADESLPNSKISTWLCFHAYVGMRLSISSINSGVFSESFGMHVPESVRLFTHRSEKIYRTNSKLAYSNKHPA